MDRPSHFIGDIIQSDLDRGVHTQIRTRFPPEPNGFLHIGHVKAICINFGMAEAFSGSCNLRFDDTNPLKEDVAYERAIKADLQWLGMDWGDNLFHASDYFQQLYDYAEELIGKGLAYVCDLTVDEIRATRGTVTEPGQHSPYRDRSVQENLDLFRRMRAGEFDEGVRVLRAKIDMASPNMKMRDPLLYRIRKVAHHRTGDAWCLYPFYDFAHCLSDSLEGISHSLCSLEFDNNRELYDWILDNCTVPRPQPRQYEFAKLRIGYTLMSKRNLLRLVNDGVVEGWDDPRMPTIAAQRRRGVRPQALRAFAERVGVSKAASMVDLALLDHTIRDDLNHEAPRVMAILRPLEVVVETWTKGETDWIDASLWPHDVPKEGSRKVPFTRRLYIDRDDFAADPPRKWRRLSPGAEVRLRYGYWVRCTRVETDDSGKVVRLFCSHDPETRGGENPSDGRKPQGTIHWVSAEHGVPCTVRDYNRLWQVEEPGGDDLASQLNPESLQTFEGVVEPHVLDSADDQRWQFERTGYYWRDPVDGRGQRPIFNRIVALKDGFRKPAQPTAAPVKPTRKPAKPAKPVDKAVDPELERAAEALVSDHGVKLGDARVLAADDALRARFARLCDLHADAARAANWLVNELPRVLQGDATDPGDGAFAALLDALGDGHLSPRLAKQVLEVMATEGGQPMDIAQARGWLALNDTGAIEALVDQVLAAHPDKVAAARENPRLVGFLIGQVMAASKGRAPGKDVQRILADRLKE